MQSERAPVHRPGAGDYREGSKPSLPMMLFGAVLAAALWVQAPAVDTAVAHALSEPALAGAHVGVAVVDPRDGALLYGREAESEYAPASTLKLLTAATALDVLGPAFRPRTELKIAGAVRDGALDGTLYLVGGGDPLLSSADLGAAAAAVRAAGIVRIEHLAVDQSYFAGVPYPGGWSWDDLASYYAPPITALSLGENALDVDVMPGAAPGSAATMRVEETAGTPYVDDAATTGAAQSDPTADCHLDPAAGAVRVLGTVPLGGAVQQSCAVLRPSAYAGDVFAAALRAESVRVAAPVGREVAPPGARVLWTHEGSTVAQLVAKMLPPSDNFIAEVLCRQIAKRSDPAGSFAACARAEEAYAASIGIAPTALSLHDGSGLSRYDLATPRALAQVLAAIARGPNAALIRGALPRPGADGTLEGRFAGSPVAGRVEAKTGSMTHVDDLAGYVQAADGATLAFAIMVEDFASEGDRAAVHHAEREIVEAIAGA